MESPIKEWMKKTMNKWIAEGDSNSKIMEKKQ